MENEKKKVDWLITASSFGNCCGVMCDIFCGTRPVK